MFPDPTFICELRRVPCCPVDRKGQLLVEATDSAQMNMLVDAKECQRVEMGSSLQEVSLCSCRPPCVLSLSTTCIGNSESMLLGVLAARCQT